MKYHETQLYLNRLTFHFIYTTIKINIYTSEKDRKSIKNRICTRVINLTILESCQIYLGILLI